MFGAFFNHLLDEKLENKICTSYYQLIAVNTVKSNSFKYPNLSLNFGSLHVFFQFYWNFIWKVTSMSGNTSKHSNVFWWLKRTDNLALCLNLIKMLNKLFIELSLIFSSLKITFKHPSLSWAVAKGNKCLSAGEQAATSFLQILFQPWRLAPTWLRAKSQTCP